MLAVTPEGTVIQSECCNSDARWLDCDECADGYCQLIVCTDCGDTVIETMCTEEI